MKKIFYLSTCDTCKRIIKELQLNEKGFLFQDIKTDKITSAQLDDLKKTAGSYETLFSRVSRQYKERQLANVSLTETDYKKLILEEYTFLKRPVIVFENELFIGNSKETISKAKAIIN
jgi:arsenate reductase